jgi:hypothetical protein
MGSPLESIAKSLNAGASTSSRSDSENMQSATGIRDEVITSLLGSSKETKERGGLSGLSKISKGIMDYEEPSLPTYKQAVPDNQDMRPTALHVAVACGDIHAVETLLNAGVSVEARDGWGATALHKAVQSSHLKVTKMLLEAKVSTQSADLQGNTALHHAAFLGLLEPLGLLLIFGADASTQNKVGLTPRELAQVGIVEPLEEMKRWSEGTLKLTREDREALRDVLGRYSKTMDVLYDAEISSKPEIALSGATGPITTRETDDFVTAEIIIKHPSDLGNEGLCQLLYACAERFYEVLDKLPDSGFAIGWNILPSDIPLCEPSSPVGFELADGEIETLWVEYKASEIPALVDITMVADELARLVPDYLVAVFDSGPCGIGIVIGEANHEVASDNDSGASDDGDIEDHDMLAMLLRVSDDDLPSDSIGIQSSALMFQSFEVHLILICDDNCWRRHQRIWCWTKTSNQTYQPLTSELTGLFRIFH